jgi:PAS domain S-box-containing protein
MRRDWSIRGHVLALVLCSVLPLLVLLALTVFQDARRSLEVAEEGSLALAETTAGAVASFVRESRVLLEGMARRPEIRDLDPAACNASLQDLHDVLPRFANLFVADEGARIICSALPPPTGVFEDVGDRDWYRTTMASGGFTMGPPQVGRISGVWVTVLAVPVRDAAGEVRGVLGAGMDLVRFRDFLAATTVPPGTVLTIDDLEGIVVSRSLEPELWVGRPLPSSGLDDDLLASPQGRTRVAGAEGIERIWGFTAIPGTPWRAWAGVPESEVYAPVREAAVRKVLLIALALALIGGIALLLHRRIRRALAKLDTALEGVGAGDPERIPEDGPDEVRQIAERFNRTLDALEGSEEARIRSHARVRAILDHADFGIFVTRHDGTITEANPGLARILGVPAAEALAGRTLGSLFPDPAAAEELLARALADGSSTVREVQWMHAGAGNRGEPRTVRLVATRHDRGGTRGEVEWLAEDVTERVSLERRARETQKLEAVGRLAGGVAHDFNNLLTVVTTSAHLLRSDRGDDGVVRDAADEILDAAARGAALTRQLLTFSRKQLVQPRPIDVNAVVEGMDGLLRRLAGPEGNLDVSLDPEGAPTVADPGQVEQVLLNLVLNARDASPDGAVVSVRTFAAAGAQLPPGPHGAADPAVRYVCLQVADRGTGIPEGIRERIFEPFFTTKPDGKGTGLGLATVYGIASQAGGGVSVESRPGRGTTITVWFPRGSGSPPTPTAAPLAPAEAAPE